MATGQDISMYINNNLAKEQPLCLRLHETRKITQSDSNFFQRILRKKASVNTLLLSDED